MTQNSVFYGLLPFLVMAASCIIFAKIHLRKSVKRRSFDIVEKAAVQQCPYSTLIFGDSTEVKRLFVEELKIKRRERRISCEQLDALLGQSDEWPTCDQIESDPDLFTLAFHQRFVLGSRVNKKLFSLDGDLLHEKIDAYLDLPGVRNAIIADFKKCVTSIHVGLPQREAEDYTDKIMKGEQVREGTVNSVPLSVCAHLYVFSQIMKEMGNRIF
jgi:hypothetical protein